MTETPLTPQDIADLEAIENGEEPQPRSLLEVWEATLANVDASAAEPISIHVATKVVASWPFLDFKDTARYHDLYHNTLIELRWKLHDLLVEHPEAKSWTGDEDAEHNHGHYLDLLVAWHIALDDIEKNWRANDEDAAVWVAVVADVRAFFFSQMGLAGHLDAIGFSLSDDEFLDAVRKAREEQGE